MRPAPPRIGTGRIADVVGELPAREPLRRIGTPVDGVASGERLAADERVAPARIVADCLDGEIVYPLPPRRLRAHARLHRLEQRMSPPVWLFVGVALLQAATLIAEFARRGPSVGSLPELALQLACVGAVTLLPAGVVLWRQDAWHSARLVLVGAIVWTTLPAVAALIWWPVREVPWLFDSYGWAVARIVSVATVVAFSGPALVAIGLDRVRDGSMPRPSPVGLFLLVGVTGANSLRWLAPSDVDFLQWPAGLTDPLHLAGSVSGAALPIELVGLGLLMYASTAALFAGDVPGRFWAWAAASAAVAFTIAAYQVMGGDLIGGAATSGLAARAWDAPTGVAAHLAAAAPLLLAFTSPIWSSASDASSWRAAPDDVFAWGEEASSGGTVKAALSAVVAVAAGTDHALAIDEAGRVAGWGNDDFRQVDVPAGLGGVAAVAAGDGFSLALLADGRVVGWGADDFGQIDVPSRLRRATAIAAGPAFGVALGEDGTVATWGDTSGGLEPPDGLSGVVSIAAGRRHCLALRADGSVAAWGDGTRGQLDVPDDMAPVRAIAAGGDFSLAILDDGSVAGWGDNGYGQLDIPANLHDVVAISAGAFHAVALQADGDVVTWGGGRRRLEVHPWRLVDFKAVAAGYGFTVAVRAA